MTTPPKGRRAAARSPLRFFQRAEVSPDGRRLHEIEPAGWDRFYRDRWAHDKVVRSTHGVNCTGSCAWQVFVKDGLITWEHQATDYPSVGPDSPEYEPRGCPRGASFSWYTYSRRGWLLGGEEKEKYWERADQSESDQDRGDDQN